LDAKAEFCVTAIITRGGQAGQPARVLVERQGEAWRLPVFTVSAVDSRVLAPGLRVAVAERFGLAVAVLKVLYAQRDAALAVRSALVALDAFTVPKDGTEPAGAGWLAPEQLTSLTFADDVEAARVRRWVAELLSGAVNSPRLPWTRPGWLGEAADWVEAELAQHGLQPAGPIEQHRTWSLSVLLRAPLAAGSAYFKALPPFFSVEPRLTQALAQRFPGAIPEVIAYDDDRHWLLMREFSGQSLQASTDLAVWVAALQTYARLQVQAAADPEFLLALGCPDRRLSVLPGQFAALLARDDLPLPEEDRSHSAQELAYLRALLPALSGACAALEACGVPYSLEHGDIHGNNIAITGTGGFIIFDWSDACLAHPFTCLATFLETVPADWHPALIQAYADEWSAYASPAQLQQALRLARPLGPAHLAVSYANLLHATEPSQRWQLAGALPFFLREVLKYKDGLS
jgi:hypothetical protein